MSEPGTPPSMLGRYELMLLLGKGGMGEVHLARLRGAGGFEKLCIVKTILPEMATDTQFVGRFHHEARVLVQLTHSNIAQVYDMGEADGRLFMAIEYISGVDLARVVDRQGGLGHHMPLPVALYVGQQLNEALGYAHRKAGPDGTSLGIVHRDVSPQNVMVSYEGEVKVIDFGLAKSAGRSKHTMPDTVLGKLGYMSPEQALATEVDHRSDTYSAGIVVWEMIAGRPLFEGGRLAEMLAKMARPTIPSLRTLRPDVSETLDKVVLRALEADPQGRYARADEFGRALNEVAVREGLSTGAEEVGNFVRTMCPQEFAAERALQSQLSTMRRGAKSGSPPSPSGSRSLPPELDGTMVRSPSAPGAEPTPAQRASLLLASPTATPAPRPSGPRSPSNIEVTSGHFGSSQPGSNGDSGPMGESQPITVPRSKTPLIVVGVLAAVALAAGGYVFSRPAPGPAVPTTTVPEIAPPLALPEVKPEPVAAVTPTPPPAPEPAPEPAAEVEYVEAKGPFFKITTRKDEHYVLLEKRQKLPEGTRLTILGEPAKGDPGKRPLLGQAAVLSVNGSLATLLFDDDVQLEAKMVAIQEATPRERRRRPAQRPSPAPATVAAVEPAFAAVEPAPAPAVAPPPAPAPVLVPPPTPAPEPIAKAPAPPPAVKAPTPPAPAAVQVATNAPPKLAGAIRKDKFFGTDRYRLVNHHNFTLSRCEIRFSEGQRYVFKPREILGRGQTLSFTRGDLKLDPGQPLPKLSQPHALVSCGEGVGWFSIIP